MTSIDDLLLEMGIALEASGLLADVQPAHISTPGFLGTLEGMASIEAQELRVEISIPDDFPCRLPQVRVLDGSALRWLPHVTDDGVICYNDLEGVSSSLWSPGDVVVEALSRALATARRGMRGENREDYATEAEWYWSRSGVKEIMLSYIRPAESVKNIGIVPNGQGTLVAVDDSEKDLGRSAQAMPNGVYIPLERSILDDGFRPERFLSESGLRGIIRKHLSAENGAIFAARCKKSRELGWAVLGIPRADDDRALIAVGWSPPTGGQWMLTGSQPAEVEVRPYFVSRMDRTWLLERGGASSALSKYRVAVVGCGAVGGYVADTLARTGIGHLLLIDPDVLSSENVFRHVLGQYFVQLPKVTSLASVLRVNIPYLQVTAEPRRVQDVFGQSSRSLLECDVIVNAMGSTTSTRWLNQQLHRHGRVRVIHTWLEPLGLGGHAVVTAGRSLPGCCECLFVDDDGKEQLHARCDFAAPNQTFTTRRAGCGGVYTPYGDVDARRTAEMVTRLVVQTLLERQDAPRLCSWRGSERGFLEAGHQLAKRFELDAGTLADQGYALARSSCPVCGRGQ